MNGICHIIGAGETCAKDIEQLKKVSKSDCIIAADGGLLPLLANSIMPDILIGDFDSYDENSAPLPSDLPVIKLTPEKDYTDIHTSILHGLEKGYNTFYLYGATGGRIDHTIANIQLLAWLATNKCYARMFGPENVFDVINNDRIIYPSTHSGYISVFSLTDTSKGVCESGLKYAINDATLTNTYPLGVSNEFIGKNSVISVKEGTLLIITNR